MNSLVVAFLGLCSLAPRAQDGPLVALSAPPQAQARPPAEGDVLVIDGVAISGDEYARWMLDLFGARMAKRFGEQWLVRQAALERGVELAPRAVDERMDAEIAERIRGAFMGQREGWLDELRRLDSSEGGYRRRRGVELEPELIATELCRLERVVPEELIARDWELFYGPGGREYTLSGIKLAVEVVMPRDKPSREEYEALRKRTFAERLARANEVRERLLAGAEFAQVARECSDDALTREQGGRFSGRFRPPGWHELFVQTLASVPVGQLSPPIYAKGGYWIVKVENVVVTPLESVRESLRQRLVELGPESFEVGATWGALVAGMKVEILPSMYESPTSSPEDHKPVIGMLINGQPVERARFALWLMHSRGEHYARDFTEHYLVEREAARRGVKVSDAELDLRLAEHQQWLIERGYKGSREAWQQQLEVQGRDEAGWVREWRRRKRIDLLAEKLMLLERRVDDEALREHFERVYGEQGKWVEARVLLVAVEPPQLTDKLTREQLEERLLAVRDAAHAKARGLRQRLLDGEDFATLARAESSDDASKLQGGRLSGRFRPDQWPDEVAAAVLALRPGEVSQPLDTARGIALFEVLSVRAIEFEAVKGELRDEILSERIPQGDLAGFRNVLYQRAQMQVRPEMYQ